MQRFIDIFCAAAYMKRFLCSSGEMQTLKLPLKAVSGSLHSALQVSR